jgi:nitroimidazol reductase NimA-like FMN-containing flavoprotein (pyridoxamine 5'-phosphate oxidase superfamily)
MFGDLDESQIDDLLNAKLIGRLGLQEDGVPYIVPISYAYDGESIVCHTQEGLKMEMMRKNPLVCFQVDDMDDLSRWKSVICWGNAEEVKDAAERKKAIDHLLHRKIPIVSSQTTHISPTWPFYPHDYDDIKGIIFKIHVTKRTGRYENGEPVKAGY